MRNRRSKRSKKPGLPPGSVVYTGTVTNTPVRMTVIDYDTDSLSERTVTSINEVRECRDSPTVSWINIDGVHDTKLIEEIGTHFRVHPLTLEDLVNTNQRPKLEEFDDYLFVVVKMIRFDEQTQSSLVEQVGIVISKGYLLSFQEQAAGDVFDSIRERIRHGRGKIRRMGADYLLYSIIDAIVDHYFQVVEKVGERVEALEDELVENPSPAGLKKLYQLKNEVYFLRRHVWPLREVVSQLAKREVGLISEGTGLYLRDVYDHTVQVLESVEMLRDVLSELLDIYLSSISHRMNSVMKVLTIITTIFMPLSFIAGVYGMNFQYMPELHWRYGYPLALGVMLLAVVVMLTLFRKQRWI